MWIAAGSYWLAGFPVCIALAFGLHMKGFGIWLGLAFGLFCRSCRNVCAV